MIIVDLQQVMLANLYVQLGNHTNAELSVDTLRHMALNSLRYYNVEFGKKYGEIVIACDTRHSWRKKVFPYYKANRKAQRAQSELDWATVFQAIETIRNELRDVFPYRVIHVEGAEADDVIASLCHKFGVSNDSLGGLNLTTTADGNPVEKILIISEDKDFRQLQKYGNVIQYNPRARRLVTCVNPEEKRLHILKGDLGDGVPNVLSDDDALANPDKRQKKLTSKRLDLILSKESHEEDPFPNYNRNLIRNTTLIDLDCVPEDLQTQVLTEYTNQAGKDRKQLFTYLGAHKLRNLIERMHEF